MVNSCPAVFVQLSMIIPCILVPSVQFDFVWSTRYSRCILSVSPALSCLDVIKDYYLSLSPRLRVPCSSLLCAP